MCVFANWPSTLNPRKVSAPLHAWDWMPALINLAGRNRSVDSNQGGIDNRSMNTSKVLKSELYQLVKNHRTC